MAERLTREDVLDAASTIVANGGLEALSMRALSEKLDIAVTSIYWHVGKRDAVIDALIDRNLATAVAAEPTGSTPEERTLSVARSVLRALQAHGALAGVAHERGRLGSVLAPARRYLAVEFAAAGLRGEGLADAVNAVLQFVSGYCITVSVLARQPQRDKTVPLWAGDPPVDAVAVRRLENPSDPKRAFEAGLVALVAGLFGPSGCRPTERRPTRSPEKGL